MPRRSSPETGAPVSMRLTPHFTTRFLEFQLLLQMSQLLRLREIRNPKSQTNSKPPNSKSQTRSKREAPRKSWSLESASERGYRTSGCPTRLGFGTKAPPLPRVHRLEFGDFEFVWDLGSHASHSRLRTGLSPSIP